MPITSIDQQFAQFVAFAQKQIDAGKKTAIARLEGDATLGGHTIKRAEGDHVGALKRSSLNCAQNDQTRRPSSPTPSACRRRRPCRRPSPKPP